MAFQLDTSGTVGPVDGNRFTPALIYWRDLSPFAQGYVEAMFAQGTGEAEVPGLFRLGDATPLKRRKNMFVERHFRDLAPETLARIMADCERWQAVGKDHSERTLTERGAAMWRACSGAGLAPYLGDDGLVYLKDGAV